MALTDEDRAAIGKLQRANVPGVCYKGGLTSSGHPGLHKTIFDRAYRVEATTNLDSVSLQSYVIQSASGSPASAARIAGYMAKELALIGEKVRYSTMNDQFRFMSEARPGEEGGYYYAPDALSGVLNKAAYIVIPDFSDIEEVYANGSNGLSSARGIFEYLMEHTTTGGGLVLGMTGSLPSVAAGQFSNWFSMFPTIVEVQ